MKPLSVLFLFIFPWLIFAGECDQNTKTIYSSILREDRMIVFFQPEGISKKDTVNMVYILDGEFANSRYEALQAIKSDYPIVVTGIINTDRKRDLLSKKGKDSFLRFLTEELIPIAENDFVIKNRVLFGHSIGGSFVLHAFVNTPNIYDGFISSSPTPNTCMKQPAIFTKLDNSTENNRFLYFSHGQNDMRQVKRWCGIFKENMSTCDFTHINWAFDEFENKNHNNSDVVSLTKGIYFVLHN